MNRLSTLYGTSAQAVSYMVKEITHICRDLKKRAPGSEGEREAGEYMADILENECGCGRRSRHRYDAKCFSFE